MSELIPALQRLVTVSIAAGSRYVFTCYCQRNHSHLSLMTLKICKDLCSVGFSKALKLTKHSGKRFLRNITESYLQETLEDFLAKIQKNTNPFVGLFNLDSNLSAVIKNQCTSFVIRLFSR